MISGAEKLRGCLDIVLSGVNSKARWCAGSAALYELQLLQPEA